jgi:hypothetical protein
MDLLLDVERYVSFPFLSKLSYASVPSVQFQHCSITIHHLSRLHLQGGKSSAPDAYMATSNSKTSPFHGHSAVYLIGIKELVFN